MNFLYEDEKWLVVNKPASISTHRSHAGDLGLAEWLNLHGNKEVFICSRLDKETSGVLVFAKTAQASYEAQEIHEHNTSLKTYYFIARPVRKDLWCCTDPLDGKACRTEFTPVKCGEQYALYRAEIHRGRTHQIRRHAASSGVAILGDKQHGGDDFVRLCLHCQQVQWPGFEDWTVPCPAWFTPVLQGVNRSVQALALADKRYPFLSAVTDSCRLIHRGEMDVAIDKYGSYLCVTGYDETLSAQDILDGLQDVLPSLSEACGCLGGVVKTNRRDPHKRKLYADMACWGESVPAHFQIMEHGLHFEVGLNSSQHVGLFLDQRDSRRRIAHLARGARVANLFAFTCSFSLHVLQAGAREVFSVDLAGGCLNRGRRNEENNKLNGQGISRFIKDDARKWLSRQVRKKQAHPGDFVPFDLVICDPPVFASAGKGKRFHVEKEWQGLADNVAEILSDHGVALFANNHQAGRGSLYSKELEHSFAKVTRLKPPLDFPQIKGQPSHVRIYWCEK